MLAVLKDGIDSAAGTTDYRRVSLRPEESLFDVGEARTQTSFHYLFQRDPQQLGLDSSATSLSGLAAEIRFSKNGGGRSRVDSRGTSSRAASFDVNDLGFIPRSNYVNTTGWVGRSRSDPTRHTRLWHSFVNWWGLAGLAAGAQPRIQLGNAYAAELLGAERE